ncbi:thioesterase family protein [Maribacter antarcticus]|uniref:thioesterase family protein n=1 Tax=Maribacter antarcticus TaxID=505250 RepID=UPI001FE07577|nr:thioesterase family protein [Maribacter antarcticus]
MKDFQSEVNYNQTIKRTLRVGPFDCDGLRVMTAAKYPVYMDFIRCKLIARFKLYRAIVKRKLAPSLGSQKLIYRKPLKVWSKFDVILEFAEMDDKWVYHMHYFKQEKEIKALGVVRTLVWKKSIPTALSNSMEEVGATEKTKAPNWVLKLFEDDKDIIANANKKFWLSA